MPVSKTYVVGLTGGIGCGKSEAARYLAELGAKHVDADGISRELTGKDGEALAEIRAAFGEDVFLPDGALNRRALAERIFSDPAQKRLLEGILHPRVQYRMMQAIDEASAQGVAVTVLDVPLLFESGMDVLCNETWVMRTDERTQIERICARDGLDEAAALARIHSQMDMQERCRRADRVIETGRSVEKTRAELSQLYRQLLKRVE